MVGFKRMMCAAVAATVMVGASGATAASLSVGGYESDYQRNATAQRVSDVNKIADMLEAYRARTGHMPLDGRLSQGETLTIIVGAPEVERLLQPMGNPVGAEEVMLGSDELLAALKTELGSQASLPVDPQSSPSGAPNAYYVRLRAGGQFMVAGFLRQPYAAATPMAPGVFGYAVRSKDGAWGYQWSDARTVKQLPRKERVALRLARKADDAKSGQFMTAARN